MVVPHYRFEIFLGILIGCSLSSPLGLYCDFEEPCAWFVSRTANNKTGFVRTKANGKDRPLTDNTNNSKEGYFIAVDSANSGSNINATLISPWFDKSGPNCKLSFAIYRIGYYLGSLNILKITHNFTIIIGRIEGNTGSSVAKSIEKQWSISTFNIGEVKGPFLLMFETVTIGDNSIIALDDIKLDNCFSETLANNGCSIHQFECPNKIVCISRDQVCDINVDCLYGTDEIQDCDKLPEIARCDFESGLCGWQNISKGELHWLLHQGPTPTEHTGPLYDHTYKNATGHFLYFYPNLATGIPTGAVFRSPLLGPPPPYHFQPKSRYYNSCKIRFFYHMYGKFTGSLSLYLTTRTKKAMLLWNVRMKNVDSWIRIAVPMPQNITSEFYLEFVAKKLANFRGDICIDDISFAPECFGIGPELNITFEFVHTKEKFDEFPTPSTISELITDSPTSEHGPIIWSDNTTFEFNTCGAKGYEGPTQSQCDNFYGPKHMQVKVLNDSLFKGFQKWKVPRTGSYIITAMGASGGTSAKNPQPSKGAFVHATFNLTQNEVLYFLIGQEGEGGCSSMNSMIQQDVCLKNIPYPRLNISNLTLAGGGGGGGGGTFVYKLSGKNKTIILLIAGGGGGMSYSRGSNLNLSDGQEEDMASEGKNGHSGTESAGAGGGFNDSPGLPTYGKSFNQGGIGGDTCEQAKVLQWSARGGFGGGGGGCTAGGAGGGYNGGNASFTNEMNESGYGGTSFVSGFQPYAEAGINEGPGLVEIVPIDKDCLCEFMCLWDPNQKKFQCICPKNSVLGTDGMSCLETPPKSSLDMTSSSSLSTMHIVIIIVCVVFLILALVVALSYFAYRKKQARLWIMRQEMFNNPEFQLNRLRQGAGMVTEYNPNYEFGGCTSTLQDLKEIPRESLTLVRALGQGAFGEVYQGFVSNLPDEDADLPVAVKTLPELSTDQAEMDFLMEALIMSKFNHPNIVRFIGVCFEKLPRFLVLELLSGGDLKSFLRENRPKPDRPSPLTMLELIKLATDIAKGCQYLEGNHFIHRDIAARNCLLTSKSSDKVVKIADFGMARDIYRADYYRKGGKAMLPVKWMPPEAFLDGIFTSKTDVWSFGVLLWEVFSLGYMPYPGRGNQEVMQLVTSGGRMEPPSNCPNPICHIMTQCWQAIPDHRPTFSTIIERLGYCTQDPDVLNAPLPVFHRPPSTERDATVMRPPDSDDVCLQVYRPHATESSSFNSSDYLIPMPIIPIKTELQSASSAESIDKLLDEAETTTPLNASPKQVKWTKNLIDNDISNSSSTENTSRIKTPAGYMSVPSQEAPPIPRGADTILFSGLSNEQLGSNNESPVKNANRVNKSPPASIARSRPSVKNPVRDVPSLLSLDKLQMNKPLNNSDEQYTGSSSDLTNSPSRKPLHDQRSSLSLDNPMENVAYVNVNVDNIPSASSSPLLGGSKMTDRHNQRRSSSGPGNQTMLI